MSPLRLRTATPADSDLLLGWRNHPSAREVPGDTGEVASADHDRWLSAILTAPDRHQLVVEVDGVAVGQVRLERLDGGDYEIGVSIDSARQREGLGRGAVEAGCRWLWASTDAARCLARVHDDNAASHAAFTHAGFKPTNLDAPPSYSWLALPRPSAGDE